MQNSPAPAAPFLLSKRKQLLTLSRALIASAILLIFIGCTELVLNATVYLGSRTYSVSASAIWGGIFVLVSGCLTRATADKPHKCHLIGSVATTIFSMVTMVVLLGVEIAGLEADQNGPIYFPGCNYLSSFSSSFNCNFGSLNLSSGPLTGLLILHVAAIILGLLCLGCDVFIMIYLSKKAFCQPNLQQQNVEMQQQTTVITNKSAATHYNPQAALPQGSATYSNIPLQAPQQRMVQMPVIAGGYEPAPFYQQQPAPLSSNQTTTPPPIAAIQVQTSNLAPSGPDATGNGTQTQMQETC